MKFEIKNRWSGAVKFIAEIECEDTASVGFKIGLAVRWARDNNANLRGADLRDADLRGANLRDANLRDANLSGADLRGADGKRFKGVPVIPDIHRTVYAAASAPGALDMGDWHCGTTHCRAGWVVTLAGPAGAALEYAMGTAAAATVIYLASDPTMDRVPNFYDTNASALADMKRLAEKASRNGGR